MKFPNTESKLQYISLFSLLSGFILERQLVRVKCGVTLPEDNRFVELVGSKESDQSW